MLAVVAVEANDFDGGMEFIQAFKKLGRLIGAAVVNEDHFVALADPLQGAYQSLSQLIERRRLV